METTSPNKDCMIFPEMIHIAFLAGVFFISSFNPNYNIVYRNAPNPSRNSNGVHVAALTGYHEANRPTSVSNKHHIALARKHPILRISSSFPDRIVHVGHIPVCLANYHGCTI